MNVWVGDQGLERGRGGGAHLAPMQQCRLEGWGRRAGGVDVPELVAEVLVSVELRLWVGRASGGGDDRAGLAGRGGPGAHAGSHPQVVVGVFPLSAVLQALGVGCVHALQEGEKFTHCRLAVKMLDLITCCKAQLHAGPGSWLCPSPAGGGDIDTLQALLWRCYNSWAAVEINASAHHVL